MFRETSNNPEKIVIAHRGASGYLPEHTLAAKAYAYAAGADFLEQDVVLTKDDIPVVLHDTHIDTVTNVADVFPDRRRPDGRYYAIDLTLEELKTLQVSERFHHKTRKRVYPKRFPASRSTFAISTLCEEIELIQGLNESTGRDVGIYPEIKKPAWHREQGKDISKIVLDTVMHYGYNDKSDNIFLQCFDAEENRRIRNELDCHLRIIQLIGDSSWKESDSDYDAMLTKSGLAEVKQYADGIGPWIPQVLASVNKSSYQVSELVGWAHAANLEVHPYTVRADDLPEFASNLQALVNGLLNEAGCDGVFTDFPDLVVAIRDQLN